MIGVVVIVVVTLVVVVVVVVRVTGGVDLARDHQLLVGRQEQLAVDGLALGVDDLDVAQQPLERLAPCGSRPAGRRRRRCARRPCAPGSAFWFTRTAMRWYSASRSSSLTSIPSASATARSARSTLTAPVAALVQALGEGGRLLAGDRQVLLHGHALRLQLLHEALGPVAQLAVDERLGRLVVDELGQARTWPDRAGAGGPGSAGRPPCARGWRARHSSDGLELAEVVADPLVGQLGRHELLDLLDGDGEVGRLLGARWGRR